MIADCFTFSRILFSLSLFVLSPYSIPFAAIYLLCGISDVMDGFLARKLHTESKMGERLDSIADLFFVVVYAVRILPLLAVPNWIWKWTFLIAIIKIIAILLKSKKEHRLFIEHSLGNKLTGFLLFLLPLLGYIADVRYGATLVCVVATVIAVIEIKMGD